MLTNRAVDFKLISSRLSTFTYWNSSSFSPLFHPAILLFLSTIMYVEPSSHQMTQNIDTLFQGITTVVYQGILVRVYFVPCFNLLLASPCYMPIRLFFRLFQSPMYAINTFF
jgi:hypothetical protein